MKDVSLYIHIPFCISKCRYCDFNSFKSTEEQRDRYIDALINEIKIYSKDNYKIKTVYIGGGTPSILNLSQINRIVEAINNNYATDIEEFSIESNPESLTEEKIKHYKDIGINRISIGVQSFNDSILSYLGRAHSSFDAIKTMDMIGKYYDNYNIDLMCGIPSETNEDLINSIKTTINYNAPHVSLYSLILEQDTPLNNEILLGKSLLPEEDIIADRLEMVSEMLSEVGINRYEISNYAKKGYECKHNINYWTLNEYIGVGLSAHGYLNRTRYANTENIDDYILALAIDKKPLVEINRISLEETEYEFIMLGLRMSRGIYLAEYEHLFNSNFINKYKNKLESIKDFIEISDNKLMVKKEYLNILNSLLIRILY